MFVAGIDAHATYSVIAIVSNTGELVQKPVRIRNSEADRLNAWIRWRRLGQTDVWLGPVTQPPPSLVAQRHERVDLGSPPGWQVAGQAGDEQDAGRGQQVRDRIHGGQIIEECVEYP